MELKFVGNQPKYWEFIRTLRNAPQVQEGFIEQQPDINPEQQKEYMSKYNCHYYLALVVDTDVPVGYIRHIDGDIGVCVHPAMFSQGVGTFMIKELMKLHPECFAKIKADNKASIKAFEKAGFKKKYIIMEKDDVE